MRGKGQGTKGEERKITMKQYPFCEIRFGFHFAAFLRLFSRPHGAVTRESSAFVVFCWFQGLDSDCQRTEGKANFLVDLRSASYREKEIRTWVSAQRPSLSSEKMLQNRNTKGRGQGAAPRYGRALVKLNLLSGAHWAVPVHLQPPEPCYRSAATLTSSACSLVTFCKVWLWNWEVPMWELLF